MSNATKSDGFFDRLERGLDAFFAFPVKLIYKSLEKTMEYTYQETKNGIFGLFDSPEKISDAAEKSHQRGYTNFDCLTPFPVHGLEFKMGLKRSNLPYVTFVAGLLGLLVAIGIQWMVHDQVSNIPYLNSYPLNIGGKPTFAWPAMVPVAFELTVLFAGHITVATLFFLGRIPKISRKILHPAITDDKFALWIPTHSANYSEEGVREFMASLGASEITVVRDEEKQ